MSRKLYTKQHSLTAGEIDPLLIGRDDVKYFYSGAEKMRNVIALPQGGGRRRPGLKYLDEFRPAVSRITASVTVTAPNGGTTANANDGNTGTEVQTTVNINATNPYVVVQYDLGSAKTIHFADVVGFRLSGGSGVTNEFEVQYSSDAVSWTKFGKAAFYIPASTTDATRRFSSNSPQTTTARYWRFVRNGATNLGANVAIIDEFNLWESTGSLSDVRLPDFTFSTTQDYLAVFTDSNIAIYKDDVWQCDVRNTAITSSMLNKLNWTQSLDTMLIVHEDAAPQKLVRQGAHDAWEVSSISFDRMPTYQWDNTTTTGTGTPAATSGTGINFTSSVAYFTAGMVGKYIRGGGGFALIAGFTSTTVVTIDIIEPYRFTNTNPIGAGDWTIEENVWSTSRGWPRSVSFHEGRLWFGGSKNRPQTLWGSKSAQFFDFGYGSGLDDEAIDVTLDTDQVSAIHQIYSGRHLSIFTESAEFYLTDSITEGITPNNVRVKRTTSRGCKSGIRVAEVSGAIMFIQRNGKALREFLWNDGESSYTASNLSTLASHLIVNPVDLALRKATNTDEADLLMLPNTDGSLCILTTLRDQSVTGFTLQKTNGSFLRVGVVDTDIYFAVSRVINGVTRQYLEKFDSTLYLDCAVYSTRPAKNEYTATLGQTTFAFTTSVTSASELRVIKYVLADEEWQELYYTTDWTATGIPGTGNVVLNVGCAAGDIVIISYPTQTFTGLTHLNGATGRIVGDGAVKETGNVSGGSLTVTSPAWETDAQAGLEFPDVTGGGNNEGVWIKYFRDMPELAEGNATGRKRRVIKAWLELYQTTHIKINGKEIAFDELDSSPSLLDATLSPFTGKKIVSGILGWGEDKTVEVTQTVPAAMTLLSLTKKVAI